MFHNIGKKIMQLAKVICWLGIAASIMCGGALIAVGILGGCGHMDIPVYAAVAAGFAVAILGSLFSWIGSFFTYGFGRLIDNTDTIVSHMHDED